jgi:hypothetical protein
LVSDSKQNSWREEDFFFLSFFFLFAAAGSEHCLDMKEIILEKETVHVLPTVSEWNSLIRNSQVTWLQLVRVVGSCSHSQDAERFFGAYDSFTSLRQSHQYKNKAILVSSFSLQLFNGGRRVGGSAALPLRVQLGCLLWMVECSVC